MFNSEKFVLVCVLILLISVGGCIVTESNAASEPFIIGDGDYWLSKASEHKMGGSRGLTYANIAQAMFLRDIRDELRMMRESNEEN